MSLRVWNLYRVSTEQQGDEGKKDIPMQKIACNDFAKQKGWKVVHEIAEKISGFQTAIEDRESISEILKAADEKEFDILLVYHSDRIGRQIEYSLFITSLYEKGVQVWSTVEGELKNVVHEDSLINYLRFWTSEGESRKTSIKVRERMKQLNEEGGYVGGNPPYGYKIVDTGKKRNSRTNKTIKVQRINEDEEPFVKMIFDLVIDKNYGSTRIAKHLNEQKILNRGYVWRHNTISRMLRNPIYMGYKRYNTEKSAGVKSSKKKILPREKWKLQPFNKNLKIISKEKFNKVQSIIDSRSNHSKNTNKRRVPSASQVLLSGLVVCGYCNTKLTSGFSYKYYKRKDGKTTKYKIYRYECSPSRSFADDYQPHEQKQFGAKTLDKHVEEEVLEAISHLKLEAFNKEKDMFDLKELDSRKNVLRELEKESRQINTAYKNTVKLFDDVMMGQSSMKLDFVQERLDEYGSKKRKIEEKITKLKEEIEKANLDSNDLEGLKRHLASWVDNYKKTVSLDEKKAMLGQVLKEVVVKKDSVMLRFNIAIENALMKEAEIENNDKMVVVLSDSSEWNGDVNTPPIEHPTKTSGDVSYGHLIEQWNNSRTLEFEHSISR